MDQPNNDTTSNWDNTIKFLAAGLGAVLLKGVTIWHGRIKKQEAAAAATATEHSRVETERVKNEPTIAAQLDAQQMAFMAAQSLRINQLEADVKAYQRELQAQADKWQVEVEKWRVLAQGLREKNLELMWRIEALEGRANRGGGAGSGI